MQDKVLIITGAGAHKDYEFPLWGELKDQVVGLLDDDGLVGEVLKRMSLDNLSKQEAQEKYINYWKMKLSESGETTLDQLVNKTREHVDELVADFILWIIFWVLMNKECEAARKDRDSLWVAKFAKRLARHAISAHESKIQHKLDRIFFATLNYDRLFEFEFSTVFFKEVFSSVGNKRALRTVFLPIFDHLFKVMHPHGAIGKMDLLIHRGSSFPVRVITKFRNHRITRVGGNAFDFGKKPDINNVSFLNFSEVDDFSTEEGFSSDYDRLAKSLSDFKKIIFVGLSNEGIDNMELNFKNFKGEVVHFTRSNTVPSKFDNTQEVGWYTRVSLRTNDVDFVDTLVRCLI